LYPPLSEAELDTIVSVYWRDVEPLMTDEGITSNYSFLRPRELNQEHWSAFL